MASSLTKEEMGGDDSDKEEVPEDEEAEGFVEETAEVLMTDMTLEDDMDKIRNPEPGSMWVYHIEVYPWHADDVNEHFIRLMKLATFTKLTMKKKPVSHESEDLERIDDKVMERQRKGSLHLYAESYQTAKAIMRHSTWKNMVSKELTFEITKSSPDKESPITARIDVDTYSMCKVRFRDKAKGIFSARSAKISNLPSNLTRDFLEIVFGRGHISYDGSETDVNKEKKDLNLHQTLGELQNFDGSIDVDSPNRGSCRAFVLAHKSIVILGNKISIAANDPQTMVVPPETLVSTTSKPKEENKSIPPAVGSAGLNIQPTSARGREVRENPLSRTGSLTRINSPMGHPVQSARIHPLTTMGRMRGAGGYARGMVTTQQPANVSYSRAGPGMPVPMTGRQKMNEKMRRNYPNTVPGIPNTVIHPAMGGAAGYRAANMNSIGDAFKHEIASLQSELERSTQAIEAKIERLREESSFYNDFSEEMQIYDEGEWEEGVSYEYDGGQGEYYVEGHDLQPHDAAGYDLVYEQPIEQLMAVARGMARKPLGRARGFVHVPTQRMTGMENNFPSGRHPVQMRNGRGRGTGVVYQRPGPNTYW